jgi:hypothetical protein
MASAHSFIITLSNNKTESEGLEMVLQTSNDLFRPDWEGRQRIIEVLGLKKTFMKTFDLVRVAGTKSAEGFLSIKNSDDIKLIELKTTKKRLPNNPHGFFFGATANEFELAEILGPKFNFAFVCLHPDCPSVKFLTLSQLEPLVRQKRTQF